METQSTACPTCGLRLDPATGRCPYCSAAPAPPPLEPAETPAWSLEDSGRERELGLLLFEAEESLARGNAEKAVVLASKAVKERPDSLTARALHERARRELLRGRRRERLESRVREAEGLLEAGDLAGAERIVTSALKLIPNHPLALALFGRFKERRQQASTAEAWAEQELERLTQARARRSLEAAQAQLAAGRERAAMMAVRRGLRHAPDDRELLAMLHDIEQAMERAKAGHRAVHTQVRAGLDLLAQGQIEESLRALRAVLRAEPDNLRAQVAVQQVRKAWLRRQAVAAAAPPSEPAARPVPVRPPLPAGASVRPPVPAAATPPPAIPVAPAARAPVVPATRAAIAPSAAMTAPASWQDVAAAARVAAAIAAKTPPPRAGSAAPAKVPSPSPRARGRALGVILGCVAVLMGVIVVSRRGPRRPPAPAVTAAPVAAPSAAQRSEAPLAQRPEAAGPLAAVEPDIRRAIEDVLAAYSQALETADAGLLAQARPDLGAEERARRLGPFTGALNAATDLRVLDVKRRGDQAVVSILRTDVIVGGREHPSDPTEETLRLERRGGQWVLVPPSGR